jgi:pilus assembly protein Flp/PilA
MLKQYTDLEVRVRNFGRKIATREQGATAVEYALMVALIAVVIIAAVTLLGGNLASRFTQVANSIGPS